ncbi:hypothetical protein BDC45DRAFT_78897 [Circinella umbellata]|nr:hypothetical protein BDC45DRAFT_78897 [Circinella umbellata]
MESDQLYVGFGFFSSIFRGSNIVAKGTKLSSKANVTSINQSRLLSSADPIQNRKMGRRGDTIFSCGDIELGCTEIDPGKDQTKGIRDSMLKMPIVLRDMLLSTTFAPSLLHKSHVIGYGIFGGSVSLLDADIPAGFVTRIRRTEPLTFPNNDGDFVTKLVPLLNLACIGRTMIETTLQFINNTIRPISLSTGKSHWCLPPNFVPSNTQSQSQKRQRTDEGSLTGSAV